MNIRFYRPIFLVLIAWIAGCFNIQAQSYCIPEANCSSGDYIDLFVFGTLINANSGASNCGAQSNNSYSFQNQTGAFFQNEMVHILLKSGPQFGQVYGIWIDYNQDGDFEDNGEFVFFTASNSKDSIQAQISIPNSAVPGNTRLRVRSKFNAPMLANESCETFNYGETEDYEIEILQNFNKPRAAFDANVRASCSSIHFYDKSVNNPTFWKWYFGDGDSSTMRNPMHNYLLNGRYTVTLIAGNTNGVDTVERQNFIEINQQFISSIACIPATVGTAVSSTGIEKVSFGGINNQTDDANMEGYQDFTCLRGIVQVGKSYPIAIESFTAFPHSIKVYIDWNGDNSFAANEMVAQLNSGYLLESTIHIPSNAQLGLVRMRVIAAPSLIGIQDACQDVQSGQAEDYGLLIKENIDAPEVYFKSNVSHTCNGIVNFTDASINTPNSWYWDFGDGNFSNQRNPQHQYLNDGVYDVKLVASNAFGSDTLLRHQFIHVTQANFINPICSPATSAHTSDYGIYSVGIVDVVNTSMGGSVGYEDFTCNRIFYLLSGETYRLKVSTGQLNNEDVKAWIDYNADGVFTANEEIMFSSNKKLHQQNFQVPTSGIVLGQNLRMRIKSDFNGNSISPCGNSSVGQCEDYGVILQEGNPKPNFRISSNITCTGEVSFLNTSENASIFFWEFGDGTTSTAANPVHVYSAPGVYNVRLTASNGTDAVTIEKNRFVAYEIGLCGGFFIPANEHLDSIKNCSGRLFDNGINADYLAGSQGSILITPSNAVGIELEFYSFGYATGDYFEIYDGPNVYAPQIGRFTQSDIAVGTKFQLNSGVALLKHFSIGSTRERGFELEWRCQIGQSKPAAFIDVDSTITCQGKVNFFDKSTKNPSSWLWDFGDGFTSTQQNPSHTYNALGFYTVRLIASNTLGSDTLIMPNFIRVDAQYCIDGVDEIFSENWQIYPNPFTDFVSIKEVSASNSGLEEIILFDALGNQLLKQSVSNTNVIRLNHLKPGLYFVYLKHAKGVGVKKIVKI